MSPAFARFLTRFYPRAWRERYGAEFEAFLLEENFHSGAGFGAEVRTAANAFCSALDEHIHPSQGGNMEPVPNTFAAILRKPSAFVPVLMSLTGLGIVLGHIALYGVTHEADEGATAHIWQLLMAGQFPVLAFFCHQMAAARSKADAIRSRPAGGSGAGFRGASLFSESVAPLCDVPSSAFRRRKPASCARWRGFRIRG